MRQHSAHYKEVLNSGRWRDLRARALQRAGSRCESCRRTWRQAGYPLDVHHANGYSMLGTEKLSDLRVLCRYPCHQRAHGWPAYGRFGWRRLRLRRFRLRDVLAAGTAVAIWALAFGWRPSLAQALADPIQVYTSADPVREGGLGLAMPDGRFAVSKGDGCVDAGFDRGMNVILWQAEGFSGVGTLGVVDEQGIVHLLCNVRIERQMDPTPCFKNAEGACDVALEQ